VFSSPEMLFRFYRFVFRLISRVSVDSEAPPEVGLLVLVPCSMLFNVLLPVNLKYNCYFMHENCIHCVLLPVSYLQKRTGMNVNL
jgi:hypothetical protein